MPLQHLESIVFLKIESNLSQLTLSRSPMHWIFFGLLAALSESFKDLASKHGLREIAPLHAGLAASAIPIPLLLGLVLVGNGLPALGPSYPLALAIGGTLNILALWQFMRAFRIRTYHWLFPSFLLLQFFYCSPRHCSSET